MERITVTRMEVAAVVDDRVVDVKAEEAMVVMEAMVEAAEEDGEDHQVGHLNPIISHLCVETSIMAPVDGTQHLRQLQGWQRRLVGKLNKTLSQAVKTEVFKWVWLKSSASEAKPNLQYLCVILKAYNFILAPQLS